MKLWIDNKSASPIYDQIYCQIKDQIASGELVEHQQLPSIRGLAKDLRISFITTKRAYEELEKDGFIYTLQAKGCYVASRNKELLREEQLNKIEEHLEQAVGLAVSSGMTKDEFMAVIQFFMEDYK
ncbi:MAG: GntR family transcriptional regulator [Clostridia bacterium]|nr:GntR family transcriptional regulator [Clostridia bacterium]